MTSDKYLNLIYNGIKDLGTAIFFDFNPSILKFPTSVITVSNVDRSGNIWFTVKKPYKDISGFRKEFFAQLQFYNKNYDYYIIVQGKATIIINEKERPTDRTVGKPVTAYNETLIRLRIFNAEYFCSRKNERPGFSGYIDKVANWLLNDKKAGHTVAVRFNQYDKDIALEEHY